MSGKVNPKTGNLWVIWCDRCGRVVNTHDEEHFHAGKSKVRPNNEGHVAEAAEFFLGERGTLGLEASMSTPVTTLPVVVTIEEPPLAEDTARGLFSRRDLQQVVAAVPVSVEKMRESLDHLCAGLEQVFQSAREVGGFRLTEVTVQVEVGAEGGFELIGTGKASGKGAITLKFTG